MKFNKNYSLRQFFKKNRLKGFSLKFSSQNDDLQNLKASFGSLQSSMVDVHFLIIYFSTHLIWKWNQWNYINIWIPTTNYLSRLQFGYVSSSGNVVNLMELVLACFNFPHNLLLWISLLFNSVCKTEASCDTYT